MADGEEVRALSTRGWTAAATKGVPAELRRTLDRFALVVVLLLVAWWWYVLAIESSPGDWAFDFRQFWQGGRDVVEGVSPYPTAALLATAGDHLGPEGIREVFRFPYPAGAAVALAPFGALGFETAAAMWGALLVVSLLGAVWILGVRDWRVLAIVVSSAPVLTSVRLGTFTPLLVLALAIAWRWRDRRWVVGGALGGAIALKVFLWPLVVWLVATRRYASAGIAAVGAAGTTLAAWAALGFGGLAEYPDLVRRLTEIVADRGYSLVALGVETGLPRPVADALPWLAGLALLAAAVGFARRRGLERVSFTLAVLASLAITPIVWLHYFALLVVPLAIARPRFSLAWLVLWVFWLTPVQESQGDLWRILVAVAASASAFAWVARDSIQRRTAHG